MAKNQPTTEELAQAGSIDTEVDKSTLRKLEEARARVAKLKADKELELLEAEERRLKNGGKGDKLIALEADLAKLRDETAKVTEHGKTFALYLSPKRSYLDASGMGGAPRLNPEDTIVRRPVDQLPDIDWRKVVLSEVPLEKKYVAA